jgi:hypothetical protein
MRDCGANTTPLSEKLGPTIAREGSKLDFVRRGPYKTTNIVLFFQLLSMSCVSCISVAQLQVL